MKGDSKPVFNREVLKDLRIKKGFSVYKLEEVSGVPQANLHNMEKGKIKEPTYGTVAAIANALEVSMDVFINKFSL